VIAKCARCAHLHSASFSVRRYPPKRDAAESRVRSKVGMNAITAVPEAQALSRCALGADRTLLGARGARLRLIADQRPRSDAPIASDRGRFFCAARSALRTSSARRSTVPS
jgi:hypothetical protein